MLGDFMSVIVVVLKCTHTDLILWLLVEEAIELVLLASVNIGKALHADFALAGNCLSKVDTQILTRVPDEILADFKIFAIVASFTLIN